MHTHNGAMEQTVYSLCGEAANVDIPRMIQTVNWMLRRPMIPKKGMIRCRSRERAVPRYTAEDPVGLYCALRLQWSIDRAHSTQTASDTLVRARHGKQSNGPRYLRGFETKTSTRIALVHLEANYQVSHRN